MGIGRGLAVNAVQRLRAAGVSIWLDDLSRELLDSGEFERLTRELCVSGATSNPTIFAKAIANSDRYDAPLADAVDRTKGDPRALFFELAIDDLRRGADALRGAYESSGETDGFVSFECTPDDADDAEATIQQALDVHERADVPNLLIKVAATDDGINAVRALTARGISVNVTLLFSLQRYQQAIEAYWDGLEQRVRAGSRIDHIRSVASFFVSRVDSAIDPLLGPESPLRGRIAIANAQLAYSHYLRSLETPRWRRLARLGGRRQRPLWASTATKDPSYSDTRYVQELVAPGVINTMPQKTLEAFADHGDVAGTLDYDARPARQLIREMEAEGLRLPEIASLLEAQGLQAFRDSFDEVLRRLEAKVQASMMTA